MAFPRASPVTQGTLQHLLLPKLEILSASLKSSALDGVGQSLGTGMRALLEHKGIGTWGMLAFSG